MPFIISFLLFIIFLSSLIIGVVFLLRYFLHKKAKDRSEYRDTILLITVPKDIPKEEKEKGEREQESLKAKISVAETLYSNLYGLRQQSALSHFFYGEHTYISLEIVFQKGFVMFYLVCPHYLENYIEQQIHAQYPEAQIEKTEDYNIFSSKAEIRGTYLNLRRSPFFPIKTYKEGESDPINALTNALSKLEENEGAAIQILIKPAFRSWAKGGLKVASLMQQGKKLNDALKESGEASRAFERVAGIAQGGVSFAASSLQESKKSETLTQQEQKIYKLSPLEEEILKGIENKASKFAFESNLRIVSSSQDPMRAEFNLNNISNAFAQYEAGEKGNGFKNIKVTLNKLISDFIFRNFRLRGRFILSTEELSSLWHLPLPQTETPNILWLRAKKAPAPVNLPQEGIILGKNVYRGIEKLVRVKREDRRRHVYIIGRSGSGKSVLLANMAVQDIKNGDGVCVLDPHGDLIEMILEHIPKERTDDVIYFDPSDIERPQGLNMLEYKTDEQKDFAVQEMIAIFYKLFPAEMIGPMFEHNMRNAMLTLMADKDSPGTLLEIPRIFTDKDFMQHKLQFVRDPVVRAFWEKEMAQTTEFHKSEMLGYLISKVGRFIENEMMRNIIGQPRSGFDFREVMDKRKILLVNLSKGKTGEVNSSLLGLIIVAKLQMAALSRADIKEAERSDFFLYMDEFQNFITDSIATILSEARKYRLNLTIAHQYLGQLIEKDGQKKILDAVLGNVGTTIAFRVGVEDAETLAKEFDPVFNQYDVINVEKFNAYIKLLIDNTAARAFNIETLLLLSGNHEMASAIKDLSRLKHGKDRRIVEAEIMERSKLGASTKAADITNIEKTL